MQKISVIFLLSFSYMSFSCEHDLLSLAQEQKHIKILQKDNHIVVDYTLDPMVSAKVNNLMHYEYTDPYKNWGYYKTRANNILQAELPADLQAILTTMKTRSKPTALVLHNTPVDATIPVTPENGKRPPLKGDVNGKGYVSEAMLLGLCSFLGAHPDYDENEKDGTFINQIIPREDFASRSVASSNGSEIPFHPHTENVYSPTPLKFFSLLCLRGDPKVSTGMIFLNSILNYVKKYPYYNQFMNDFILEEMKQPQFIMKSGPSFEGRQGHNLIVPILDEQNGQPVFRFNANPTRVAGINDVATFVVDHLKTILKSDDFLKDNKFNITLQKGDLLLFNNHQTMHARDAFTLDKNNWRWLQRSYFMLDKAKL